MKEKAKKKFEGGREIRWTEERHADVQRFRNSGMRLKDIAGIYGVSRTRIMQVLAKGDRIRRGVEYSPASSSAIRSTRAVQ